MEELPDAMHGLVPSRMYSFFFLWGAAGNPGGVNDDM